jgi:hypothetical protein
VAPEGIRYARAHPNNITNGYRGYQGAGGWASVERGANAEFNLYRFWMKMPVCQPEQMKGLPLNLLETGNMTDIPNIIKKSGRG